MANGVRFRSLLAVAALAAFAFMSACVPAAPGPTRLDILTTQTICGGAYNPDLPPGRTSPTSVAVQVLRDRDVVASGTTGVDGHLVVEVPVADLTVVRVDAPGYQICTAPAVTAVAGQTTPVTQDCTILAP